MTTYDVHAHAIVPDGLARMASIHPDHGPVLIQDSGASYLQYPGRARLGPMPAGMFDPEIRLREMDDQRVDVQVIAVPPPNYFYHLPPEVGVDFARIQNDHLCGLSDTNPDRFHVFATLPLQDVEAALEEVDRIVGQPRVRGVQIGTNISGTNLDTPDLEPIWSSLERHDLPVWVHGDQRALAGAERLGNYYLQNFIGQPLESTIAMGSIIFGGVLERHPGLRFGWVHGGGFVPYQIGRWDHGWGVRDEATKMISDTPPSVYFSRMWFDSLTHDSLALDFLGRRVGWDHVVLGSDYPFDMASADPVGGVDAVELSETDRRRVLEDNAIAFLRPMS